MVDVVVNASANSPLNVLIVDDDLVSLLVAAHIVRTAGHMVTTASGAIEALEAAADNGQLTGAPIDVIVCDYNMPDTNGLDLLEALQDSGETVPPFILLTGVADADDLEDERVRAVTAFLTKPVQSDLLVAAVSSAPTELQRQT